MKTLCLDVGTKKIGVAISDPLGITAQGVITFNIDGRSDIIDYLKDFIANEGVNEIVVGLPLNMDGSKGPKAKEAVSFADKLRKELNINVLLWDERMTTLQVERIMIEANTSRAKRKKKIDKLAAQLILQSYLDSK